MDRMVARVEAAATRIEDRVNKLELDAVAQNERIVTLGEKLDTLVEELEEMAKIVTQWKSGAIMLFAFGAVAMWVFENFQSIRQSILGR